MSRQGRNKKRGGGRGPGRATSWVYPFEVRREVVHQVVERKTPLSLVSRAFYISEMTIRNWLVAYQLGGEAALMPKTAGRKPSPLDRSDPVVAEGPVPGPIAVEPDHGGSVSATEPLAARPLNPESAKEVLGA